MIDRDQLTSSGPNGARGAWYEIRVEGALDARWAEWFGGLAIDTEGDEVTVISGFVVDQAVLHGLLTRVRDLGLALVSVNRLPPREPRLSPGGQR